MTGVKEWTYFDNEQYWEKLSKVTKYQGLG